MPPTLQPGPIVLPSSPNHLNGLSHPRILHPGGPEVVQRVEHAVPPPKRRPELKGPLPHNNPGRQPPAERPLQQVLTPTLPSSPSPHSPASGNLVSQQPFQRVERRVERRPNRPLNPLAVPPTIRELVLDEPFSNPLDRRPKPHPVGQGPGVDAAVHLTTPIGQPFKLPPTPSRKQLNGPLQHRRVKPPLPQRGQRPGSGRPRLSLLLPVKPSGKEGPTTPHPIGTLKPDQPSPEPLKTNPSPSSTPNSRRRPHQIPLHLPPQRRVGVKQPPSNLNHTTTLARSPPTSTDTPQSPRFWRALTIM